MYRGEFIDDDDNRIFLLTSALRYDSDEVLKFALGAEQKLKGKVSYGVVNYAGIQVVEIYGDPEKVIKRNKKQLQMNKKTSLCNFQQLLCRLSGLAQVLPCGVRCRLCPGMYGIESGFVAAATAQNSSARKKHKSASWS